MNAPNDQPGTAPEKISATEDEALVELAGHAIGIASLRNRRIIFGIAGGPGSGKSTVAEKLVGILNDSVPGSAARVPMDGFHLPHAELVASGADAKKGAPQTFDAQKFVNFLKNLKAAHSAVSVPGYSRRIEDVVPDAFKIAQNVPILVVEGNYLLLDQSPWHQVRPLLDFAAYLAVPRELVRTRLLKRHAEHDKFDAKRNIDHVDNVDLANYDLVQASQYGADLVIALQTDA